MAPRAPWRSALLAFVLFGGVGLALMFGAAALGLNGPEAARQWLAAARGPWSLPVAIACFAVLAFVGVPQLALIAAAVAVFGPWQGLIYSWIGTMVSALVGFGLGRLWGPRFGSAASAGAVGRLIALTARNGFLASLVIRLVPFAPFVVVNMAAGVTAIRLFDFILGTGIGILPKIVLTAVAGDSVSRLLRGQASMLAIGLLALAGVIWVVAAVAARRWMKP